MKLADQDQYDDQISGADPGFLERGFMYIMVGGGLALLIYLIS